jgi:peroxiredoxin
MNYLSFIGGAALALGMGTLARHAPHGAAKAGAADSTYTLTGTIAGGNTGWVYLLHRERAERMDSVKMNKGQFVFSGQTAAPQFCLLGVNKEFHLGFFLQSGTLRLTGSKDKMEEAVVTGAPVQDEYIDYQARLKSAVDWASYQVRYKAAQAKNNHSQLDSLGKAAEEMTLHEKQFSKDYAKAHPSSYVAVLELRMNFSYNPDVAELQEVFNGLDPSIQRSHSGIDLRETLDAALKTAIGQPAPDFTQTDVKGNPVALSSFKGKYVLVDFWASWCGPCRLENPSVVKAYRQYHSKGFTVLGISLDDKKDKWLEAIRKDGLDWTQVSDLKGWQNSVALSYGIKGIPMNFLLDKDGKIVGKGLRDEDLDKKLAELVH